jgi:hypothetical protein
VTTKTGAYTVAAADRGRVIACSGTFTVTLPDAGAVDAGFAVAIGNYGDGTITVDPYSTQTIDGATTKALAANTMLVACSVAGEWLTVGGMTLPTASTSQAGIVQLSTSVSSTSTTLAATASAVKAAYDLAAASKRNSGAAAGTHYQYMGGGETNSTIAVKVAEARCLVAGTLRTYMRLRSVSGSASVYGRIYKNESPVGTLRSTMSSLGETFAEDISFAVGDLIQVYAYSINSAHTSAANFALGANSSAYGMLAAVAPTY